MPWNILISIHAQNIKIFILDYKMCQYQELCTHLHTLTLTNTLKQTHKHTHTYTHTDKRTHKSTHTKTHTQTNTNKNKHNKHTYIRTHTYMHTHTQQLSLCTTGETHFTHTHTRWIHCTILGDDLYPGKTVSTENYCDVTRISKSCVTC